MQKITSWSQVLQIAYSHILDVCFPTPHPPSLNSYSTEHNTQFDSILFQVSLVEQVLIKEDVSFSIDLFTTVIGSTSINQ